MKFEIKSRWSGEVQFTAEIEANEDTLFLVKLGLAVKAAVKAKACLEGADLEGAYLRGADLRGAYLRGAYLRGADLRGAYLRGAYLEGACLEGADLEGADLEGAYLEGAYLRGAYGSNLFVRSVSTGTYDVAYTADIMQIGCQRHTIADWWSFDDERIAAMDGRKALTFWRTWKPILQAMIAAAPAAPTGYVSPPAAEQSEAAS